MQTNASRPSADVLRLVAKNLTEMVLAYDMSRRLVFVNPAAETLTGYSMEELEKANFICWVHPEDQARMMAFWEPLFQGKPFHEEEYRLVTRDGRVKWVVASWIPILDDGGTQVGVQGREFDVTRRKLAEAALRHSEEKLRIDEERYRVLFENSPFPMWEEDFSAIKTYFDSLDTPDIPTYLRQNPSAVDECVRRVRILDVNQAARNFYGASSKEELLAGLEQFFDDSARENFRDEMSALAAGDYSFQAEFTTRTLRGEERLVDMIVTMVDSARCDWSRVIVSFFDITDRKRLEEQFFQSHKMESLGRLAGGIAHDFNNLLTVINGYSDWMLRKMEPDNPFRAELAEVRDAGQRCAELTQQLLAFSRKQIVRAGPLDLNHLIRESQGVLRRVLGDGISLAIRLAPDLGTVEADASQMQQVLLNLAINAREAMASGGTLTLATANSASSQEILLEIRDTGQGMDETTRRHLFEPFFTTKKGSRNAGLGLAIVFGIVNHGGGRIEVASQPGAGSVFRIHLPRVQNEPEPAGHIDSPETTQRGVGPVLVVEDREDVRDLTCRMLEELGYETLLAASGAEALAIARGQGRSIPLLLTDVIMPGMNGRELADQFRRLDPKIKIIFMSGYTDRVLAGSHTLDSDTPYLQKPFTLAQLAEILRKAEGA
ncbi:MAG: PAS domain S-box protein [Candidatus Sulfopaludibacter sp.]|nr:PAS domain S-box protein [Candidatus Sulfopaludibacter sp.]